MTDKKTEFFDSISPLTLDNKEGRVDERGNLQADWNRYGTLSPHINGVPLSDYLHRYNEFSTEEDVKRFFKEVLLADAQLETGEDNAIEFLLTYFRQKGFMQPVTVTLERTLLVKSQSSPHEYQLSDQYVDQQIDIKTTANGFTIQEFAIVTKLNKTDRETGFAEKIQPQNTDIPYLIKAEGTLDFDFREDPNNPKISIKSNFISYGHPEIQSLMGERSFLKWLIDCIAWLMGKRQVEIRDHSIQSELDQSPHDASDDNEQEEENNSLVTKNH